jgi:cell division protein FtsL
MINDSEETEVVEDTPVVKPRFTPVIVLSVLLGMLMTVVAVGSLLSYQRGRAVNAEMQALKNELKERNRVHDDLQTQIEALSRQMAVLKEYSVARSSAAVRARETKPEAEAKADADAAVVQSLPPVAVGAPPANDKPVVSDKPAASDKLQAGAPSVPAPAVSPPPEQPKVKRSKPEGQSCELVGKSAEEQAAILKRCVGLMDAPKDAKSRK